MRSGRIPTIRAPRRSPRRPFPPLRPRSRASPTRPPNDLQRSLSTVAVQLPTAGAHVASHVARLSATGIVPPDHATVGDAAAEAAAHMQAFIAVPPDRESVTSPQ